MSKVLCHLFFDEYPKDSRVRRYTNTLVHHGCTVVIICIGASEPFREILNDNITVYRLPIHKKRSGVGRRILEYVLFEVFALFMTAYVHVRYSARIYHVHTLPDFLVFSCLVPKILGARIILDFHELFPEFMLQHHPALTMNSLVIKALLLQEKWSVQFADTVITFHDPAKSIIVARTSSAKIFTVVMNGIDVTELPAVEKRNDDMFRIIYNGTINYNLNLGLVLDALRIIREQYPDMFEKIEFALYGDGPDLQNILDKAHAYGLNNVRYHGRVRFNDMVYEIAKASVCILPPKKDIYSDLFYSLKLLEMIYFRIPVIATRLNTYRYYYPEDCISYFDSDDVYHLVSSIVFVFQHPSEIANRSDKAFLEYQKYSWDIMSQRYLGIVEQLW